jgi:hypothetical protein
MNGNASSPPGGEAFPFRYGSALIFYNAGRYDRFITKL